MPLDWQQGLVLRGTRPSWDSKIYLDPFKQLLFGVAVLRVEVSLLMVNWLSRAVIWVIHILQPAIFSFPLSSTSQDPP